MKVQITQTNLLKALNIVSRVVGSRTTLPVLANVLLEAKQNKLYFLATNLEIGITYVSGVKVAEEGKITVPAKLFLEYIATLPEGAIEIETEKNTLKINSLHNESTINGASPDEFPSIPSVSKGASIVLDAQTFKAALNQVVLVASTDDSRPVLSGVYLYLEGEDLVVVATDSYRLAEKIIKPLKAGDKENPVKLIIPARTAQEILRVIDEESREITILYDSAQVVFKIDTIEIVSRLIDGAFPDYRQLIPKEAATTLTIETKAFAATAKTAGLFARESGGGVIVTAKPKEGIVSIASNASQVGAAASEAAAEIKGEEASVSVNSRYILDALGVIGAEKINFLITGKVTPCLIRPIGSSGYLHLIMPLRS